MYKSAHLEGEGGSAGGGTASRVLTGPLLLKPGDLHHCFCEQVGDEKDILNTSKKR